MAVDVNISNTDVLDEISYQVKFYKTFYGKKWDTLVHLDRNTDGYTDNIFFEHKKDVSKYGIYKSLSQAILYLTKFNMEGVPVPAKIALVSQAKGQIYIYETKNYLSYIEDIEQYGSLSPSRGIDGFVTKENPKIIEYFIESPADSPELFEFIKETKGFVKVNITKDNVYGWSRYYYENAKGREKKKDKFFEELKKPKSVLKEIINPWLGGREDFALIMDLLNDPATQKKLGAFYSPLAYCEKARELVQLAIDKVPEGNDYIILDRCSGTGNLEMVLSDEQLTHVIINTYELQEWIALKNRIGHAVRHIIPPIPKDSNTLPKKNEHGFLSGANALSESFINNSIIKKYLDNPKCTVILLENPPYRDSSSSDKENSDEREEQDMNVASYVYAEMKKYLPDFDNSNISTARDVVNQFIWSGFKYYLRQPTDSYILFCPAKCYKSLGMLNYKFEKGYLFNREHFHAASAGIMCALWLNEKEKSESVILEAYNLKKINDMYKLDFVKNVEVKRVYNTLEQFFDRRKFDNDVEANVYCETNGKETTGRKCDGKSYYNDNIIAYCRTINFPIAAMNRYLTRQAFYGARGFYIRKDNFLEKLPLFVSKCYPLTNWYDKEVLMTSSDGGTKYMNDKIFLKHCLIYTCLTAKNKCVSFIGSDGNYYKNELCLDGDTLAMEILKTMDLNDKENELLKEYFKILDEIKRKDNAGNYFYEEYNPSLSYGVHQIVEFIDIDIPKTDKNGIIITKKDKNGKEKPVMEKKYGKNLSNIIRPFNKQLQNYYMEFIAPKMLEYELVK